MRFSLCIICGNETAHIGRMLASFAPIFDELSLVRAIGSKQADDSVEIARTFCAENGKAFLFTEYRNSAGAEKWDHVDSFAKARNAAFAQATGDWLIWADCDDTLENADGFRARLEASEAKLTMVRCLYDVRGTNKKLFRERAIRAEAFRSGRVWHNDVHENLLLLSGDTHADWDAPVWVHQPVEVKKENRIRNLRILKHAVRDAATQYFYIHQEHYCSGNRDVALEFGKIALTFPNLEPAFRYEALLNCARLCYSKREANLYLMEAHGIFPWCREALVGLILLCFERKDYAKAKVWAERMLALREPLETQRPWTHEAKWYGWAGYDLGARAYRAEGSTAMADVLQWQFHGGMTPKISLLHATRGRTSKAVSTRENWMAHAANPSQVEHIFAVDADDETSLDMARQFISVTSDKKSCVAAWNLAARKARGDLIVQLSDDWHPCVDWDKKLLEACGDADLQKQEVVVAIDDGHRKDQLLCMAICSRARLEKQGDLFFEGYESVFSDNEFSARAWCDGIVIDARSTIRFEHQHPAFGKGQMDATYKHNNAKARYEAGKVLFEARNPEFKSPDIT